MGLNNPDYSPSLHGGSKFHECRVFIYLRKTADAETKVIRRRMISDYMKSLNTLPLSFFTLDSKISTSLRDLLSALSFWICWLSSECARAYHWRWLSCLAEESLLTDRLKCSLLNGGSWGNQNIMLTFQTSAISTQHIYWVPKYLLWSWLTTHSLWCFWKSYFALKFRIKLLINL